MRAVVFEVQPARGQQEAYLGVATVVRRRP